ncbi:hypothetical protein LTR53_012279 [Teratosphaeriaceae sp. CCFEE 6253]|nr:hypothetical protein LTR53_012279 [Teratosphaeriaceae sp. CCFEE 6253]
MGGKSKQVHFDLPDDAPSEMAAAVPLKPARKQPTPRSDSDTASPEPKKRSSKAVAFQPAKRKSGETAISRSESKPSKSATEGEYEYVYSKKVEAYSDGRRVTTYKKSLSYWP